MQLLAVIQPFRVIIGPAQYQDIAAQFITDRPPCFTVGTRHLGFQASLALSKQTQPDVRNNVMDDSSDHITYFQSSDIQVV